MYFVADVEGVDKMGMRETVGSLRAYFILSGLAGIFSAIGLIYLNGGIVGVVIALVTIGFSLAFLYVGFALAKLLRSSSSRITTLLYSSAGWSVFAFLLSILGGLSAGALVTLVLSLLIVWYLLRNVRRLAGEAQAAPTEPPISAPN
jgi:hypothetical protein